MDEKILEFLNNDILPINIGAHDFGETLETQGSPVVYVDWSPPAAGDQEMIDLLDLLM